MNMNSFLKAIEKKNNNLNVTLYHSNNTEEFGADWSNEVYSGTIKIGRAHV